nr:MAG TPA: hypothetical protein [Caudoviricetes sp.]
MLAIILPMVSLVTLGFIGLTISHWQRIKKYSLLLQKESDLL